MRVLVVEDHAKLALAIAAVLRREGMAADVAFDGSDALDKSAVNRYDVIVLDRDLPGVHGDEVCRQLAASEDGSGMLMLTASATIEDRVEGLGLGADDYLPKPFDIAELVARIRALARRTRPALPPVLAHGDLRLDPARREATRGWAARWSSAPRSSRCCNCCSKPRAPWSRPRNCWNGPGMRWPTRSPTPSR